MKNKSTKNELTRSSSPERAAPGTSSEGKFNEISASEMEGILKDARQAVKPVVKREAENEIVSEEILSFKMVRV